MVLGEPETGRIMSVLKVNNPDASPAAALARLRLVLGPGCWLGSKMARHVYLRPE